MHESRNRKPSDKPWKLLYQDQDYNYNSLYSFYLKDTGSKWQMRSLDLFNIKSAEADSATARSPSLAAPATPVADEGGHRRYSVGASDVSRRIAIEEKYNRQSDNKSRRRDKSASATEDRRNLKDNCRQQ